MKVVSCRVLSLYQLKQHPGIFVLGSIAGLFLLKGAYVGAYVGLNFPLSSAFLADSASSLSSSASLAAELRRSSSSSAACCSFRRFIRSDSLASKPLRFLLPLRAIAWELDSMVWRSIDGCRKRRVVCCGVGTCGRAQEPALMIFLGSGTPFLLISTGLNRGYFLGLSK